MLGAYNPSKRHVLWINDHISYLRNRLAPYYGNANQLQRVIRDYVRDHGRVVATSTFMDYAKKDISKRGPTPPVFNFSTTRDPKVSGSFDEKDFHVRINIKDNQLKSITKQYDSQLASMVDAVYVVSTIIHETIHAIQLYPMYQYFNDKTITKDEKDYYLLDYEMENYGDTYETDRSETPAWASDTALMMAYFLPPKYYLPDFPEESLKTYYQVWGLNAPFIGNLPMLISDLYKEENLKKEFYRSHKERWANLPPPRRRLIKLVRPDIFRPGGDILKSVRKDIPFYLKNLRRFMRAYQPINASLVRTQGD